MAGRPAGAPRRGRPFGSERSWSIRGVSRRISQRRADRSGPNDRGRSEGFPAGFLVLSVGFEREAVRASVDHDAGARLEFAAEDFAGERVFEVLLDRALERAGAVLGVPTDFGQEVFGAVGELDAELAFREAGGELRELDVDDF